MELEVDMRKLSSQMAFQVWHPRGNLQCRTRSTLLPCYVCNPEKINKYDTVFYKIHYFQNINITIVPLIFILYCVRQGIKNYTSLYRGGKKKMFYNNGLEKALATHDFWTFQVDTKHLISNLVNFWIPGMQLCTVSSKINNVGELNPLDSCLGRQLKSVV